MWKQSGVQQDSHGIPVRSLTALASESLHSFRCGNMSMIVCMNVKAIGENASRSARPIAVGGSAGGRGDRKAQNFHGSSDLFVATHSTNSLYCRITARHTFRHSATTCAPVGIKIIIGSWALHILSFIHCTPSRYRPLKESGTYIHCLSTASASCGNTYCHPEASSAATSGRAPWAFHLRATETTDSLS